MISKDDKAQLKAFVENEPLMEAVRRQLIVGIVGEDFAKANWVFAVDEKLDDAQYGRAVKIRAEALKWVERAFNDLKRLAGSNPQPGATNEAR